MTKAELTKLAVHALGEGATVDTKKFRSEHRFRATSPDNVESVDVWHRNRQVAMRALAAALQAIADGR